MQTLDEIAARFDPELGVVTGKWFGKPCLKVGGKVFAALWGGDMAFKLAGKAHSEALQIKGARLFDPRGKGRPMREWVQIPAAQATTWQRFAELACEYVAGAAQAQKDKIIADLIETRKKILDAASLLTPSEQDKVFLGVWSVKDLLAHLVGWDLANKEAAEAVLAGEVPGFYAHYDRDWQSYNARLVKEHKGDRFDGLLASVKDSRQKLIDFLKTVPSGEFAKDKGVRFKGYKVTVARILQAEIDDEKTHYAQVKEFADRNIPLSGEES